MTGLCRVDIAQGLCRDHVGIMYGLCSGMQPQRQENQLEKEMDDELEAGIML